MTCKIRRTWKVYLHMRQHVMPALARRGLTTRILPHGLTWPECAEYLWSARAPDGSIDISNGIRDFIAEHPQHRQGDLLAKP